MAKRRSTKTAQEKAILRAIYAKRKKIDRRLHPRIAKVARVNKRELKDISRVDYAPDAKQARALSNEMYSAHELGAMGGLLGMQTHEVGGTKIKEHQMWVRRKGPSKDLGTNINRMMRGLPSYGMQKIGEYGVGRPKKTYKSKGLPVEDPMFAMRHEIGHNVYFHLSPRARTRLNKRLGKYMNEKKRLGRGFGFVDQPDYEEFADLYARERNRKRPAIAKAKHDYPHSDPEGRAILADALTEYRKRNKVSKTKFANYGNKKR